MMACARITGSRRPLVPTVSRHTPDLAGSPCRLDRRRQRLHWLLQPAAVSPPDDPAAVLRRRPRLLLQHRTAPRSADTLASPRPAACRNLRAVCRVPLPARAPAPAAAPRALPPRCLLGGDAAWPLA